MIYPIWFANYQPYGLGIKLSMIFSSTLNDQKTVNEKSGASVGPHTEDSKSEKKSTLVVCKKNHNCSGPSFCNLGEKKTESRRIRYNAARSLHQSQIISLTIWSWLLTNFDLCLCICLCCWWRVRFHVAETRLDSVVGRFRSAAASCFEFNHIRALT